MKKMEKRDKGKEKLRNVGGKKICSVDEELMDFIEIVAGGACEM